MTMMGPGDDLRLFLTDGPSSPLAWRVSAGLQETGLGSKARTNQNKAKFTGETNVTKDRVI